MIGYSVMHKSQRKLLDLIRSRNIAPLTLRKIGDLIDVKHPQKIKYHLNKLKEKGFININSKDGKITKVEPRSKTSKGSNLINIPIYGGADCGPAQLLAEENLEGYLRVSPSILANKSRSLFALKASGSSMNRANVQGESIEEGDYVLVDGNDRSTNSGDYIISIIDGCANIKKFLWEKENNRIVLMSESTEDYPPIYIHEGDEFLINAKVVQVLKKPKGGDLKAEA